MQFERYNRAQKRYQLFLYLLHDCIVKQINKVQNLDWYEWYGAVC